MKVLTIRLDQGDLNNIKHLQEEYRQINTISKTIKMALADARKYHELRKEIRKAIKIKYELPQGMIEHLNAKYFGYDTVPVLQAAKK